MTFFAQLIKRGRVSFLGSTKNLNRLLKEIARSLRKLSKDRLVIVSFAHCNNEFEKSLLPVFDKCIEITNDVDNIRILRMKVYNKRKEESSCDTQKGDINVDASEMNKSFNFSHCFRHSDHSSTIL